MSTLSGIGASFRDSVAHYRNASGLRKVAILLLSVVAAMLVGSLLILAVGADPLQSY